MYFYFRFCLFVCRCFTNWYTRDVKNTVEGYKLNLQHLMSSKMPNSVLQFMLKHTYFRKVSLDTKKGSRKFFFFTVRSSMKK